MVKNYYSLAYALNLVASKAVLFPLLAVTSLALVGRIFAARSRADNRSHVTHNVAIVIYNVLCLGFVNLLVFLLPMRFYGALFFPQAWVSIWGFTSSKLLLSLIAFVILDFTSFAMHFLTHRFFWGFHKVHHRPTELGWLVTDISHPIPYAVKFLLQLVITAQLGLPMDCIVYAGYVRTFYTYFVHIDTGYEYRYGLQYLFVSPAMHKAHHVREGIGRNFGFCLSIWDVLCGTYADPRPLRHAALGINDASYPRSYWGEMAYPFRKNSSG